MSFFSGISDVEDNPPNSKIFSRYAQKLLEEVDLPINDANTLKATVYLCFSQIACIAKMTRGKIENSMMEGLIENMVKDAVTSIKGLGMITIGDLATNEEELNRILSGFPQEAEVDKTTSVNGLGAWDAVYLSHVEEIVPDIVEKFDDESSGFYGRAALKTLEGLRGPGNQSEKFMEVNSLITVMTGEVIKALR